MTLFDRQRLAARVRTQRGGRSLREVADEIAGVSLSTLSRVENGRAPDVNTFLALCDWLGASPAEFFPGAEAVSSTMETSTRIELALRADPVLGVDFIDAVMRIIHIFHVQASKNARL